MLVSGAMGNSSIPAQEIITNPSPVVASASANTTKGAGETDSGSSSKQNQKNNNLGVEEAVREYFADIPLMVEISKCESRYRQFETDGTAFRGKINANDVGALQINETYHLKRAEKLGYDIYSLQGNMAYARLLFQEQGPQPWSSSYPCWGKSPLAGNFKPKVRNPIAVTVAVQATTTTPALPVAVEIATNTPSVLAEK